MPYKTCCASCLVPHFLYISPLVVLYMLPSYILIALIKCFHISDLIPDIHSIHQENTIWLFAAYCILSNFAKMQ
jgi:hypothetical protein